MIYVYFFGPLLGILGLGIFFTYSTCRNGSFANLLLPKHVTMRTEQELEYLSSLIQKPVVEVPKIPTIPVRDMLLMYFRSRENRSRANEEALADPHSKDRAFLLERITEDHCKIRSTAIPALRERAIGRLVPNYICVYSRDFLWAYSEEQVLVSRLEDPHSGENWSVD